MKYWLQSKLIYFLSRFIPSLICLYIGHKLRRASQAALQKKNLRELNLDEKYMAKLLDENDANYLICGHTHKQQIKTLEIAGRVKTVYVLPPCEGDTMAYLLLENNRFYSCTLKYS